MRPEASLLLGGPQGAGLETAAQALTSESAHTGRRVHSYRVHYSNVRGRHTYIVLRFSSKRRSSAPPETLDIMALIDTDSHFNYYRKAGPGTLVIHDISVPQVDATGVPSIDPETLQRILLKYLAPGGTMVVDAPSAAEGAGARLLGLMILGWLASDHGYPIHRATRRYVNIIPLARVRRPRGLAGRPLVGGDELREAFNDLLVPVGKG